MPTKMKVDPKDHVHNNVELARNLNWCKTELVKAHDEVLKCKGINQSQAEELFHQDQQLKQQQEYIGNLQSTVAKQGETLGTWRSIFMDIMKTTTTQFADAVAIFFKKDGDDVKEIAAKELASADNVKTDTSCDDKGQPRDANVTVRRRKCTTVQNSMDSQVDDDISSECGDISLVFNRIRRDTIDKIEHLIIPTVNDDLSSYDSGNHSTFESSHGLSETSQFLHAAHTHSTPKKEEIPSIVLSRSSDANFAANRKSDDSFLRIPRRSSRKTTPASTTSTAFTTKSPRSSIRKSSPLVPTAVSPAKSPMKRSSQHNALTSLREIYADDKLSPVAKKLTKKGREDKSSKIPKMKKTA